MNIQEIKIDKFPVVIFSDSHCNIQNIIKLQELYPNCLLLSLGDITFLFNNKGDFNQKSIDFFIQNKIPVCLGNHEQHILSYETGTGMIAQFDEHSFLQNDYGLNQQQLDYLKNLPIGFKLVLPNNKEYLCFHHSPLDLWGFFDKGKLSFEEFKKHYPINSNTLGVITSHTHLNFIDNYPNNINRYSIGTLANGREVINEHNKSYVLLTEKGIEYKRL